MIRDIDTRYVVTSHSSYIRPDNPIVIALTRLGYSFEPGVVPFIEDGFCGPDMDTRYTRKSILNSHICTFGYIPYETDTKIRRHHVHSVLTMNELLEKEVYINALCVNKIKNYSGAGKLLRDMIVAVRSIGIRRMALDAIPSENTIRFYNKHKFEVDSWYSPSDVLMEMERFITPPETTVSPGTPEIGQKIQSANTSPTMKAPTMKAPAMKTGTNELLSWLDNPEELQDIIQDIKVMPDKHVEISFKPLSGPPPVVQSIPKKSKQRAFRTRRTKNVKRTGIVQKAPRKVRQNLSKGIYKQSTDFTVKMPKMVMV